MQLFRSTLAMQPQKRGTKMGENGSEKVLTFYCPHSDMCCDECIQKAMKEAGVDVWVEGTGRDGSLLPRFVFRKPAYN